jgi:hypothetical protein
MSNTVAKLEEARVCLLAVLGPRDGRLHRVLALIESALLDFWRPGDEDNGSMAGLPPDADDGVWMDETPPRPRAG